MMYSGMKGLLPLILWITLLVRVSAAPGFDQFILDPATVEVEDVSSLLDQVESVGVRTVTMHVKDPETGHLYIDVGDLPHTALHTDVTNTQARIDAILAGCADRGLLARGLLSLWRDPVACSDRPDWCVVERDNLRSNGRKMEDVTASTTHINPADGDAQDHVIALITALDELNLFDGWTFDEVTFLSEAAGYEAATVDKFESDEDISLSEISWRDENWITWVEWKASVITEFLKFVVTQTLSHYEIYRKAVIVPDSSVDPASFPSSAVVGVKISNYNFTQTIVRLPFHEQPNGQQDRWLEARLDTLAAAAPGPPGTPLALPLFTLPLEADELINAMEIADEADFEAVAIESAVWDESLSTLPPVEEELDLFLPIETAFSERLPIDTSTKKEQTGTLDSSIVINKVSPNIGGVNGGTIITVIGSGFEGAFVDGITVFVGDSPCEVIWYQSKDSQVVCKTSPAPYGDATDGLPVTVVTNGDYFTTCEASQCFFSYVWSRTPIVHHVTPMFVSPGSVLSIQTWGGNQPSQDVDWGVSFEVHDENRSVDCIGVDENDEPYVKRTSGGYQYWNCRMPEDVPVGPLNITLHNPPYGTSLPSDDALVFGSESPFMVVGGPSVEGVSPSSGSLLGGTLVEISGQGFIPRVPDLSLFDQATFGDMPAPPSPEIAVSVNGVECDVLDITEDSVSCKTGSSWPPAQEPLPYYVGGRGLRYEIWKSGGEVISIDEARAADASVNPPDEVHLLHAFEGKSNYLDYYVSRYRGFFIAPATCDYTFLLSGDDQTELWLSTSTDASLVTKIAFQDGHSSFRQFYKYETQQSEKVALVEGEAYYMEAYMREWGGGDHLTVAVVQHCSDLSPAESPASVVEVQSVTVENVELVPEVQTISLAGVNNNVTIEWGGREFDLAYPFTSDALHAGIEDALSVGCTMVETVETSYATPLDFETSASPDVQWWSGDTGVAARTNEGSHCGRRSLNWRGGSAILFDGETGLLEGENIKGFNLDSFSHICFAYNIAENDATTIPNSYMTIRVQSRESIFSELEIGWWYFPLFFDDGDSWALNGGPHPHRFAGNLGPLVRDGQWHHTCVDIAAQFDDNHGPAIRTVTAIQFSGSIHTYDVLVDDFGVWTGPIVYDDVARVPRADLNGSVLKSVAVEVSAEEVVEEVSQQTITVTAYPHNCGSNLPLIGATLVGQGSVDVVATTTATPALSGSYTLTFGGETTAAIPVTASITEIQDTLSLLATTGDVTVAGEITCSLVSYKVDFKSLPGDIEEMVATSVDLDDNTVAIVSEEHAGGRVMSPIPSEFLRTADAAPSISMTVNGIVIGCAETDGEGPCTFEYLETAGASVTNVDPTTGGAGTEIVVTGTGFTSDTTVTIGQVPCDATVSSDTSITCTVGASSAGSHGVVVWDPTGYAQNDGIEFVYNVDVTAISPATGGEAGGLSVTVEGDGFGADSTVVIGSIVCTDVEVVDHSTLTCTTTAGSGTGDVTVTTGSASASLAAAFTYDAALTPTVDTITPSSGPAYGGYPVVLGGSNFGTVEGTVHIGAIDGEDVVCEVTSWAETEITCTVGAAQSGVTAPRVFRSDGGLANTNGDFEHVLRVDSVEPLEGSHEGGTLITITGDGFLDAAADNSVTIGDKPCDIESVSGTVITCRTRSSNTVHQVDNLGVNPEYGKLYAWNPATVDIEVGDQVHWSWVGIFKADMNFNVETAEEGGTVWDEIGFKSELSHTGGYEHEFTEEGTTYYVSNLYGWAGMKGTVNVAARPSTRARTVTVSVGVATTDTETFTYSDAATPTVTSITSSMSELTLATDALSLATDASEVELLLYPFEHDEFRIETSMYRAGVSLRESDTVAAACTSLTGNFTHITCALENVPAGAYRVALNVDGFGFSFQADNGEVAVVNTQVDSLSADALSTAGGATLDLVGSSMFFGSDDVEVMIGNTPCVFDSDQSSSTNVVCTTEAVVDDGFSAVVLKDEAVGYWRLENLGDGQSRGVADVPGGSYINIMPLDVHDGLTTNHAVFFNYTSAFQVGFDAQLNPVQSDEVDGTISAAPFSVEAFVYIDTTDAPGPSLEGYRVVLSSFLEDSGKSNGWLVLLNPCGAFEFWLGTGESLLDFTYPDSCDGLTSGSSCPVCVEDDPQTTAKLDTGVFFPAERHWMWSIAADAAEAVTDQWVQVLGTYEDGIQKLYVDGALVATVDMNADGTYYEPNEFGPLNVGGLTGMSAELQDTWFHGLVDEVSIYDKSLNEEDAARHYFYAVTEYQPLSVEVNGLDFECTADVAEGHEGCAIRFSQDSTPTIHAVSPNQGSVTDATQLTVSGSGFGSAVDGVSVTLGDVPCDVASVSDTEILCDVREMAAGTYTTSVVVHATGNAVRDTEHVDAMSILFTQNLDIDTIEPLSGSTEGSQLFTVNGYGFGSSAVVTFNGVEAESVSAGFDQVVCRTPAGAAGATDVTVTIGSSVATVAGGYEYATALTPVVTGANPSSGVSGDSITIQGSGFSVVAEENTISIGHFACTPTSTAADEIHCDIGVQPSGEYAIDVVVAGKGRASSTASFTIELGASSISPTSGSFGGHLSVIVGGSGFDTSNPDANSVVVCETPCDVVSVSASSLECRLNAWIDSSISMDTAWPQLCDVTVEVGGITNVLTEAFEFTSDLSPTVTSLEPTTGGTGGGTLVTIGGTGFGVDDQAVDVFVGDSPCVIETVADTEITCRTTWHKTTVSVGITVSVDNAGVAWDADGLSFRYIDRWSSRFTWGGGSLPVEGDTVYIGPNQHVLLDVSPPVLKLVLIEGGSLTFDDSQDLTFDAHYIMIDKFGSLTVGTEEEPFQHQAIITLHGHFRTLEIPVYGSKCIGVRRGTLDLHGAPTAITWTTLAETAVAGSDTIYLEEAVSWPLDSFVLLAPTGLDRNEAEVVQLVDIQDDGTTLVFNRGLSHTHLGFTQDITDPDTGDLHTMEIRGEVALLSRNVVVQGGVNPQWQKPCLGERCEVYGNSGLSSDGFGVQIFVHPHHHEGMGAYAMVRMSHTEVRHAGQANQLGRYAIHFHMSRGMVEGSYLKGCSIHHSFNRALTIHGSHRLVIEDNVAFDIRGHTYFFEDGIENENTLTHNLGVTNRVATSLLNTDLTPAMFWITNPYNHFTNNAAVGSAAHGFWYALEKRPEGPSRHDSVCPDHARFGSFEGNSAHSNSHGHGLFISPMFLPRDTDHGCSGSLMVATYRDFNSWANHKGVFLFLGGLLRFENFKLADNVFAGIDTAFFTGEGANWGGPLIKDFLIIANTDANQDYKTKAGLKTPASMDLTVTDVVFARFGDADVSCLAPTTAPKKMLSAKQGGFMTAFERITYIDSPNKAHWDHEHMAFYDDRDGTLTGIVGGTALPSNDFHPPSCVQDPFWGIAGVPGSVCPADVQFRRMLLTDLFPGGLTSHFLHVINQYGESIQEFDYTINRPKGFMFDIVVGEHYEFWWNFPDDRRVDPQRYVMEAWEFDEDDWVTVKHELLKVPDHFVIGGNSVPKESAVDPTDAHGTYHLDEDAETVTFVVKEYNSNFVLNMCPVEGCAIDPLTITEDDVDDLPWVNWSDPAAWINRNNIVPEEGDDVTIEWYMKIILDIDPPHLNRLTIDGKLAFGDERDETRLSAGYIFIRGDMSIGSEDLPYQNRAVITLEGDRDEGDDWALTNDLNMSSKVIGVFGSLTINAPTPEVVWTRLETTAEADSTELHLMESVEWKVGDLITIAPTEYDPWTAEKATIAAVSDDGKTLTLEEPLDFKHYAGVHELDSGYSYHLGAEVGLLTRNVVIEGGEMFSGSTENYGARIIVGSFYYSRAMGALNPRTYTGVASINGAELRNVGQRGWDFLPDARPAILFRSTDIFGARSSVKRSSIHECWSAGIAIHDSHGVRAEMNVFHKTIGSAIRVDGFECIIRNNLAVLNEWLVRKRLEGTFEFDTGAISAWGNVAAGGDRFGFVIRGDICSSPKSMFRENHAHSLLKGVVVRKGQDPCVRLDRWTLWKNWEFGIVVWMANRASSVEVSNVLLVDNTIGTMLNVKAPGSIRVPDQVIAPARATVTYTDSNIVARSPNHDCETSLVPPANFTEIGDCWAPNYKFKGAMGTMMSTFAEANGNPPCYPIMFPFSSAAISGRVEISNVEYHGFDDAGDCGRRNYAVQGNLRSVNAMHPTYFSDVKWSGTPETNKLWFHEPDEKLVKFGTFKETCGDMDCDGQKHSIIVDADGSFSGIEGATIIPRAEIRFDDTRLPIPMLSFPDGSRRNFDDVVKARGIYRGEDQCEWNDAWNGYHCEGIKHRMFVMESLDPDSQTRRLSPVAVATEGYVDLVNGGFFHYPYNTPCPWCRPSTFHTVVASNKHHEVFFTGTTPKKMRLHYLNADSDESITVAIFYADPQRLDVYNNGIYIVPLNAEVKSDGEVAKYQGDQFIPTLDDHNGANYHYRSLQTLYVTMKGETTLEIRTSRVVQVSLTLEVTTSQFFEEDLLANLAFVLEIDPETIKIVDIVAETRRRRLADGTEEEVSAQKIVFEIGDPPEEEIEVVTEDDVVDDDVEDVDVEETEDNEEVEVTEIETWIEEENALAVELNTLAETLVSKIQEVIESGDEEVFAFTVLEASVEETIPMIEELEVPEEEEEEEEVVVVPSTSSEPVYTSPYSLELTEVDPDQLYNKAISPSIVASFVDANSDVIASASYEVSATLLDSSGAEVVQDGVLNGVSTVNLVDGVATFDEIKVKMTGDFKLSFSLSTEDGDYSAETPYFNVDIRSVTNSDVFNDDTETTEAGDTAVVDTDVVKDDNTEDAVDSATTATNTPTTPGPNEFVIDTEDSQTSWEALAPVVTIGVPSLAGLGVAAVAIVYLVRRRRLQRATNKVKKSSSPAPQEVQFTEEDMNAVMLQQQAPPGLMTPEGPTDSSTTPHETADEEMEAIEAPAEVPEEVMADVIADASDNEEDGTSYDVAARSLSVSGISFQVDSPLRRGSVSLFVPDDLSATGSRRSSICSESSLPGSIPPSPKELEERNDDFKRAASPGPRAPSPAALDFGDSDKPVGLSAGQRRGSLDASPESMAKIRRGSAPAITIQQHLDARRTSAPVVSQLSIPKAASTSVSPAGSNQPSPVTSSRSLNLAMPSVADESSSPQQSPKELKGMRPSRRKVSLPVLSLFQSSKTSPSPSPTSSPLARSADAARRPPPTHAKPGWQ